jgi:hypothetical protein
MDELSETIRTESEWMNYLTLSSIELIVGSVIFKLMQDGGMTQILKIADLRHKMAQNRKRRDPRAYVRWSVKQCCKDWVEYD